MTDQQRYRAAQFKQLQLKKSMESMPALRLETEHGETKRLNITCEEMEAITAILMIQRGS